MENYFDFETRKPRIYFNQAFLYTKESDGIHLHIIQSFAFNQCETGARLRPKSKIKKPPQIPPKCATFRRCKLPSSIPTHTSDFRGASRGCVFAKKNRLQPAVAETSRKRPVLWENSRELGNPIRRGVINSRERAHTFQGMLELGSFLNNNGRRCL